MNNKIKELAELAHYISLMEFRGFRNGRLYQDIFTEKFAELVIKECVEVVSDYNDGHYMGIVIEQHFGIDKDE